MRTKFSKWLILVVTGIAFSLVHPLLAAASNQSLVWNQKENKVDADITSWDLSELLQNIAASTGWKVYLEPDLNRTISAKFEKLPTGEALHSLLGNLNYVVMPPTNNGVSRLYVFRTSRDSATRLIRASKKAPAKRVPNQFIVTLKPGAKTKIEDLAKLFGAKIVGRMDAQNAYLLEFADEAAANAARAGLADNPDVQGIDSNFYVQRPPDVFPASTSAPQLQLTPQSNNGNCQLVIGLIDTPVQSLGTNLAPFILPSVSVDGINCTPPTDTITHGTAMASTMLQVLQKVTGGKTSVKIQPVDVYGCSESTTTWQVAQGIMKASSLGANVFNLSLGSDGDSPFLGNLVTQATQQGNAVFAAAGNTPVTTLTYPAAYPGVVAVTASDRSGNIASYANHGSFVDVVAPGDAYVNYNNQTWFVEGTSTATAYASSMAAGLADKAGDCASGAVTLLKNSSSSTISLGPAQN